MTIDVEVVVRVSGKVVQDTMYYDGPAAPEWTEQDVRSVITTLLLAVDRAATGGTHSTGAVTLRGLSWIVTPFDDGSALAIEITAGSVVAGPFDIPEATLTRLVSRAISLDAAGKPS